MSSEAPPRPRRRRIWIWALAALLLLAAGAAAWIQWLLGPTGASAIVEIPEGAGAQAVGRILETNGLVRSGRAFALYARWKGAAARLQSGYYKLEGRGVPRLVEDLTGGRAPVMVRLVFPEGWRAVDYAERLEAAGFDGAGFLSIVRNPPAEWTPAYVEGPTLEGYLFPDTYDLPKGADPAVVVTVMLRRFDREVTPERVRAAAALKLSIHGWVTLASIVQAEAGSAAEMPAIAGVFLNRLDAGMPLQSDPTVAYALGKKLPELDRYAGDFDVDSPYNTYKHPGLPPGPIDNPGLEALLAVLNPQRSNANGLPYFYFFHAGGRLYLSSTFNEHLRKLNRYYY
ncbi:endolytic transglycosylase MltG [Oceanithermus sp.]|uniref:endolytic transglycosylase MltG n=1 Tax=Oceanithermus sp. TaxID=2268145 RepID=UPI00257F2F15|nr:endolytic transglycosylase MltG [Oceanithermus sp.]